MSKNLDQYTLVDLLWNLKVEACHYGRFPRDRIAVFWFDTRAQWMPRDGFKPFRSVAYNRHVRWINALERMLDGKKGST